MRVRFGAGLHQFLRWCGVGLSSLRSELKGVVAGRIRTLFFAWVYVVLQVRVLYFVSSGETRGRNVMGEGGIESDAQSNLRERSRSKDDRRESRVEEENDGTLKRLVPGKIASGVGRLTEEVKKGYQLVKFHALPEHLRDNEFILSHYRTDWPFRQALGSIFSIHNETLNIWTHLLGFLVFAGLTIYTALSLSNGGWVSSMIRLSSFQSIHWQTVSDDLTNMVAPQPKTPITRWPFFVFLSGAMFCLLSSSTCHLLMCHSERVASLLLKLDYIGIAYLIAASFFPPVYYTFMCEPSLRNFYLSGITALGILIVMVSLLPMFQTHQYRPFRAILFGSMGVSGIVPCVHKVLLHWHEPTAKETFYLEVAMGALYGLGAVIYTTRIPERWKPGRFDIAGHSHQLFHVLVVAGALTHYRAGLLYLEWRDTHGC